jgi:hypothetical protein
MRVRTAVSVALFCLCCTPLAWADGLRVATFRCDVTPPLGQPMQAGDPLRTVERPLLAKGVVLEAGHQRYVLCAVDWCELCNGSHDAWQRTLATAAGTVPAHVAVQTVHQHTAPFVDIGVQKLVAGVGAPQLHVDPQSLDAIESHVAAAVKEAVTKLEPFDQIGTGQAMVERVAASRRPVDASGKIAVRWSKCYDPAVRALPEGRIDPYLKTITLARGERPLVRLHYYATHPQTRYGDGRASSDFVGDARERLERKEGVFQIYFDGCGGDITVGKYNDGGPTRAKELAERLLAGMEASVAATKLAPAGAVRWRTCPLLLPPRTDGDFTLAASQTRMKDPKAHPTVRLYSGATRVAFAQRAQQPIELSSLAIGNVHIVHLPGEPMIEFQFFAQRLRPTDFVAVAGYGDCGTGYICTARAFIEGGYESTDSNVKPESEGLLKKAITALLNAD